MSLMKRTQQGKNSGDSSARDAVVARNTADALASSGAATDRARVTRDAEAERRKARTMAKQQ